MKKILKGLICAGLAASIGAGMVGAAGCNNNKNPGSGGKIEYRDPEKDALRLAIGGVDQKFNPMFYTSLNDGTIANLTQVSLITTDSEGKLVVGDDQPTVALDYLETYYDANGTKLATGDGKNITAAPGGNVNGDQNGYTTYEFLIKNNMKFSDGEALTVMDVLFNLYVYLDPLYSGSSTIYSTRIEGLQAYRSNTPGAPDTVGGTNTDAKYYIAAQKRYEDLYKWANNEASNYAKGDLKTAIERYQDMLNTDWNSIATSYAKTYEDYYFTEAWQAFFFSQGVFEEQKKPNDNGVPVRFKDGNGKYATEIDPKADAAVTNVEGDVGAISSRGRGLIQMMEYATVDSEVNAYIAEHPGTSVEDAKVALQKKEAIEYLYTQNAGGIRYGINYDKDKDDYTIIENKSGIKSILSEGYFASIVIEAFYQDELTKAASEIEQVVKNISGITVSNSNQFNGKTLDEKHDILKIKVVGVDPKAKWNFGFSVAPMHYYSGTYESKNYVEAAMNDYKAGRIYDGTATEFGVKYSDINFTNYVLAEGGKNGVPIGAGPYMCMASSGGDKRPGSMEFFDNNVAYFKRNDNFTTMGSGVDNAKIKYVTYKVTGDDQIVNSLTAGEIDYGEPIAKADNQTALRHMAQTTYETGGYGYIGINPKYVEDREIRQAIMMSFDTSHLRDYYGNSLVNIINRPMSNTSWVWDYVGKKSTAYTTPYYKRASKAQEIIDYIEANGAWRYKNGTWTNTENGKAGLSFNFTIAGESTDHPAYDMFTYSKRLLEQAGFSISVGTDIKALTKLVTGDLQVWAAAWSSSIDPDPYQIYSIYSKASSTKNWNKDGIMNDATGKYNTEQDIAEALNKKIMSGRQTLDERARAEIYAMSTSKTDYSLMSTLDLIMELAVEFPTYQRKDLCVYNGNVLDSNSMHIKDASHNMGPISELWKVSYHVRPAGAEQ